jgi:hypothetical protein
MPASTTRDALFAVLDNILVDAATRNGADDEMIRALRGVPPAQYRSMDGPAGPPLMSTLRVNRDGLTVYPVGVRLPARWIFDQNLTGNAPTDPQ